MNFNQITLIGNVTKDPVVSEKFTKFTLATNDSKDEVNYHQVICFNKQAEFVNNYVKKGSLVGLSGRVKYGNYTNKDGVKIYTTDIIANLVSAVNSRSEITKMGDTSNEPTNVDLPF